MYQNNWHVPSYRKSRCWSWKYLISRTSVLTGGGVLYNCYSAPGTRLCELRIKLGNADNYNFLLPLQIYVMQLHQNVLRLVSKRQTGLWLVYNWPQETSHCLVLACLPFVDERALSLQQWFTRRYMFNFHLLLGIPLYHIQFLFYSRRWAKSSFIHLASNFQLIFV